MTKRKPDPTPPGAIRYSVQTGELNRRGDAFVSRHFVDRAEAFAFARKVGTGEVTKIRGLGGLNWAIVCTYPVPSIADDAVARAGPFGIVPGVDA